MSVDSDEARQRADDSRREGYAALEQTVLERTRELSAANHDLAEEFARRLQADMRVGELLVRVMSIQEDERTRISRDLHDQVGQQITALKLQLEALGEACTRTGASEADVQSRVERAMNTIATLDHDLDYFTWELRPAPVDEYGFAGALRRFVAEWSETFSIAAAFHGDGLDGKRHAPLLETNLYRILQEALTNVVKHAPGTPAQVRLLRNADHLEIEVCNAQAAGGPVQGGTGQGGTGHGLLGIRERAAVFGGRLDHGPTADGGYRLNVWLPLDAGSQSEAAHAGGSR
jgi:signal transduction histidine kinase